MSTENQQMEETLTPEQIKNWRQVIFMQLEKLSPGSGAYAVIMPDSEVVAYWRKMKSALEPIKTTAVVDEVKPQEREYRKPKCKHTNTITGQNGTYCLDCEEYI